MTTDELYMQELHEWDETISFYLTEISIFEERLAEVAQKNTKQGIMASVELFQNQFIAQRQALQQLSHDVHAQQAGITANAKHPVMPRNMDVVDAQFLLRDRAHMAEKVLLELKHSFYRFLARVL